MCVCQCEDRLFTAAGTVLHRARPWTCPTVSDHLAASSSDTTANWARDVSTPPAVTLRQLDNLSRLQPSEEVQFFNRRRVVGSIPDFGVHVLLPAPPPPAATMLGTKRQNQNFKKSRWLLDRGHLWRENGSSRVGVNYVFNYILKYCSTA